MNSILVVSGPVIVEDGKVLVTKHGDTPFWKFCGGRVSEEISGLQANALRRARQEVGVDLVFSDQPPFFLYTQKETSEGKIDVILVHFLAERRGEVVLGEGIRESAWLDLKNLPADLGPNIIPALTHFGFLS